MWKNLVMARGTAKGIGSTVMAALLAVTLSSPSARAADGDLVIDGRAAQALQCSAMLVMVSTDMHEAGMLDEELFTTSKIVAAYILVNHVPGTTEQKKKAIRQRIAHIMKTRKPSELFKEFRSTFDWCGKEFIPKPGKTR